MFTSMRHRRDRLIQLVQDYVHEVDLRSMDAEEKISEDEMNLVSLLHDWLEARDEKSDRCTQLFDKMQPLFMSLVST